MSSLINMLYKSPAVCVNNVWVLRGSLWGNETQIKSYEPLVRPGDLYVSFLSKHAVDMNMKDK